MITAVEKDFRTVRLSQVDVNENSIYRLRLYDQENNTVLAYFTSEGIWKEVEEVSSDV